MALPEALQATLGIADEDYLMGLSNKGTVNRAKKDLAALADVTTEAVEDGIRVIMGDISCVIRAPLGESTCTCPSSGICRHRIAAILLLRNQQAQTPPSPVTFDSLRACPPDRLEKTLGQKRLAAALLRWTQGVALEQSSMVSVELPWYPATVRLVEPLEHSTCTCHSKTFCIHKAEALLYWQLTNGVVTPDAFHTEPDNHLNLEAVKAICNTVRTALTEQLTIGLSRMPSSVCDSVERMAALSHTAGLANLERALRRLHGEYAAYFARSATFRDTALLEALSYAFGLATALWEGNLSLAGIFRDDYQPVGNLRLYLLGLRQFVGQGGYAGTIYYFYQEKTKEFYTFTHIRPTFYEGKAPKTQAAPWGLPCTLEQAWNHELDLRNTKASRGRNLSATEQCQATLLPGKAPGAVFPTEEIQTDFRKLLEQARPHTSELSRLAVIHPERWERLPYDPVRQVLCLRLFDRQGRDLWLEVKYRETEAPVIEALERLKPGANVMFFAAVYRDGDKLKGYPIECFTNWEGTP